MKKRLLNIAFGLLGCSLSAQIPSYIPTNGLVAYYPFDGNANDISGNNFNGTALAITNTTNKNGVANKAYSFNGSNSAVDLGINDSINSITKNYSISYWFKKNGVNNNGNIISSFSSALGGTWRFILSLRQDSTVSSFIGPSNWNEAYTTVGSIPNNTWTNMISVRNNTVTSIYINGVLTRTTAVSSSNLPNPTSPKATTKIGVNFPSSPNFEYFNGDLDEMIIYKRALTPTEVTQMYDGATVGIKENSIDNSALYSFQKTIYFTSTINNKLTLKLTDLTGKVVYNEIAKDKNQINVTNGLYFANLVDENKNIVLTKKIIIE